MHQEPNPPQTLPPLHDTPHKFPWAGIKIQIMIILTHLVAPSNPRRQGPGDPTVQKQLLDFGGIMPLLNCCVYDGHNEYLKERATLAIKFVMEGCDEAQKFVRELVPLKTAAPPQQIPNPPSIEASLQELKIKIDNQVQNPQLDFARKVQELQNARRMQVERGEGSADDDGDAVD